MNAAKLRTRRQMRLVSAQVWEDFKAQWPMELAYVLGQMGGGFIFGLALGLAALVQVLAVVAV